MTQPLVDQVGALLKGRGVNRSPLDDRVPPDLRRALELPDTLPDASLRAALRESLESAARHLPPDLADTFLAAAGVTSKARLLEERLLQVGALQGRGLRTMRRRLDEAKQHVVEALVARAAFGEPADADVPVERRGWTFDDFALTLDLSEEPARYIAHRTIVALRDGLVDVTDLISLPPSTQAQSLHVEALHGCSFAGLDPLGLASWSLRFRLPRPLARGQRHQYAVTVALATWRDAVHPSVHLVPLRACETFTATLVQGDRTLVTNLGRLDGVMPTDPTPPRTLLAARRGAHLVTHTWTNPTVGLRYGLAWDWAD